ncbi:MAG: hypothetical protein ABID64_03900 [Nitrospirota bacterium]
MKRFTVFTVILTVIIVVVLSEVVVNDYLPRFKKDTGTDEMALDLPYSLDLASGQANVLGADVDFSKIPDSNYPDMEYEEISLNDSTEDLLRVPEETFDDSLLEVPSDPTPTYVATESDISDFEDDNFVSFSTNVFIREDMIKSAGFAGAYLENEAHDGYLYKTIYLDDLPDVEVSKYAIRTEDSLFAKVYVFQVGGLSSVSEVFEVLKMRATAGLDIEVNETSDYGDEAFYMNDSRRSEVAFLTVRMGAVLYGFSYPKDYHSQIKNLITLIDYEF